MMSRDKLEHYSFHHFVLVVLLIFQDRYNLCLKKKRVEANLAYRAGIVLVSKCSEFFLVKIIAAIFDFYSCRRLERKKFVPSG